MTDEPCANRVCYFEVAPGLRQGKFGFEVTDWRAFLAADVSVRGRLLVFAMVLVETLLGRATMTSEVERFPDRDRVEAELTCEWATATEGIERVD